jgi:hypothetical protein
MSVHLKRRRPAPYAPAIAAAAESFRDRGERFLAEVLFRKAARSEPFVEDARHVVFDHPADAAAWLRLSEMALGAEDPEEARVAAERAAQLEPLDPRPQRVLASVAFSEGRPADALVPLHRAAELGDDDADLHVSIGVALKAGGAGELSMARFADALDRDPDHHLAAYATRAATTPRALPAIMRWMWLIPVGLLVIELLVMAQGERATELQGIRPLLFGGLLATLLMLRWSGRQRVAGDPRAEAALRATDRQRRVLTRSSSVPITIVVLAVVFSGLIAMVSVGAGVGSDWWLQTAVVLVPCWIAAAAAIWVLVRRRMAVRRSLKISDHRRCACVEHRVLDGEDVRRYTRRHLRGPRRAWKGASWWTCPTTGVRWLELEQRDPRGRPAPLLARAGVPSAES